MALDPAEERDRRFSKYFERFTGLSLTAGWSSSAVAQGAAVVAALMSFAIEDGAAVELEDPAESSSVDDNSSAREERCLREM
jgi:hypothetical protein